MKVKLALTVLFFLCLVPMLLWAEPAKSAGKPKEFTGETLKEEVQNKIDALNKREGMDEALKTKVLSIYQEAADNLDLIEKNTAQTADYRAALKTAPVKTRRLQKEIESYQKKGRKQRSEDWGSIPTEELEQRLIIEKGKATSLDDQIQKKETELVQQNNRLQLIREEIVAAKQAIANQDKQTPLTTGLVSPVESEARQIALKSATELSNAKLKMLEAEALSNPVRVDLLKAELQWLEIQRNEIGSLIESIEVHLAELRQKEAQEIQEALSQAEKELSGKHPLIQQITRENLQYTSTLQDINNKIEKYTEQKNKVDAMLADIGDDFKSAEKKINLAGLSPALGKILREQRRNLATQSRFLLESKELQNETARASLEQLKAEDQLQQLENVDAELKRLMSSHVDQNLPGDQRMRIQAELRVLLNSKKDLLKKISAIQGAYLRTLGELDFSRQQLESEILKFAKYLDERLLWVPSSEPVNLDFFSGLYESLQWILSPLNWLDACQDLLEAVLDKPFKAAMAILFLIVLSFARKRSKAHLSVLLQKAEKIYTDSFGNGVMALVHTILIVLPLPAFLYLTGMFLNVGWQADDFSKAVGAGFKSAAVPLCSLQFFYRMFAADGIAVKHFKWQKSNAHLMRRHLGWARFIAVTCIFLVYCTGASKSSTYADSLGRLALIAIMIAMSVFFGFILKPSTGLLKTRIQSYPGGWVARLRFLWYPILIISPLVVMGFAVAGYYLSAVELQQKLIVTLRLAFGLILVHEMVLRWLTLANRQLAIENARQKRKTAMQSEKTIASGEEPALPVDEQLIDIPKINAQTIKLMNVSIVFGALAGFAVIWRNILPAFSFLDRLVLWQQLDRIDSQEVLVPVTLANLLWAGLYVFITTVAVRNFSGVMELLVFRRFSIEAGVRYAANQLATYALIAAGFIAMASELGGSWSQVQWLVAALGVGLGFGLQEIFANLVSGIILLFERPVRVGDTVTIGDITGKVCRIQMRATTLLDWDQKELIVPNKTFITNQLINWSLTSEITRLVIPVGIAYGSNVEEAHQVMIDTVKSTPLVLAEPEPTVLFVGFGDSSLDFSIRVFVSELSHRLQTTHNILLRLEKAFRDRGIEIPFPQRDIHIRSVSEDFGQRLQLKPV